MFAAGVAGWEKRGALACILRYLRDETVDRAMIVYGLRRTGKTTMLKQAILDLSSEELAKAAYVKISPTNIQHSLRFADDGRYFGRLHELYEAGELTDAVNRIIEDRVRKN